jgi:hypothetical protein
MRLCIADRSINVPSLGLELVLASQPLSRSHVNKPPSNQAISLGHSICHVNHYSSHSLISSLILLEPFLSRPGHHTTIRHTHDHTANNVRRLTPPHDGRHPQHRRQSGRHSRNPLSSTTRYGLARKESLGQCARPRSPRLRAAQFQELAVRLARTLKATPKTPTLLPKASTRSRGTAREKTSLTLPPLPVARLQRPHLPNLPRA